MTSNEEILIGIDPGSRITGYGVLAHTPSSFRVLDFGCIRPPPKASLSERYLVIFESIEKILEQYTPHEIAIETQFVHKNPQTALKLGIAQGVCLIAAKRKKLSIYGYSPKMVKKKITGTGKASKQQLLHAISRFLNLKTPPKPQDAADALALAICHAHCRQNILFSHQKFEL